MGRRGRRPHPDILTPREWEVLDLLRQRLTNEQIAQRLGISLDGAKFHVSEIMSKLGASSREEAARTRPSEMRPWWMRLIALPAAARITGALTLVAAAAVLAVLTWGVVETGGPAQQAQLADLSDLPEPKSDPVMTRDAALIGAIRHLGVDPRRVDVEVAVTTFAGAERVMPGERGAPQYDSEATAWIVRFTGIFDECPFGPCGPALGRRPATPPPPSCREIFIFFPDAGPYFRLSDGSPGMDRGGSAGTPSAACRTVSPLAELSRDQALMTAALDPDARVHYGPTPLRETLVEPMTIREAQEKLRDEGWQASSEGVAVPAEAAVWLVTLKGLFVPPPEQIEPSPPGPSDTRLVCTEAMTIIDAASGGSWHNDFRTAEGCYHAGGAGRTPVITPSRTPTVTKDEAIRTTPEKAGIIPGQSPGVVNVELLALDEAKLICYCYPYVERPDSVWVITFQGEMSEPLNPKAPATPPPSQPRCSELIAVVSADTGNLFASIFQHSTSCS